jgi:hypothetical protein
MRVLKLASALAASMTAVSIGIAPATAVISPNILTNQVSPAGNAAFTDLTTCLTSGKTKELDVFYLVDNSGSLRDTDARGIRFDVIENSISQLGDFADSGVSVRYAVGIFSTDASLLIDWTPIEDSSGASTEGQRSASLLESNSPTGRTDWEDGLNFADEQLSDSEACRALIWFTDGAINPDDTDPSKFRSLDALCHAEVSSGRRDSDSYGLFAKFKEERVSVFTVLLEDPSFDSEDQHFVSYLQPLVEGSGQLTSYPEAFAGPKSGELTCAPLGPDGLALAGQSNGALLRAEDPVALAYQFLKLETQFVGGSQSSMNQGKFNIGAGTVGFRIVTLSGRWSLEGPADSAFSADSTSAAASAVLVNESSSVLSLDVEITEADQLGEWTFESASSLNDVFVFSGLTLDLDRDRESMVISGRDNTLTGQVRREPRFGSIPVDLSVYDQSDLTLELIYDGQLLPVNDVSVQVEDSGQFRIEGFQPPANLGDEIEVRLTLNIGQPFQPIRAEFILNVIDAGAFPTLREDVVVLSNLTGPEGAAVGLVEISGPTSGEGGVFCFAEEASRTDDPAKVGPETIDRVSQFEWKFEGSGAQNVNGETCFTVAAGESVAVNVIVTNPVQADSRVISIRAVSSNTPLSDTTFEENITFEFATETEQNSLVTGLAIALLLILGILIPLLLLYAFNKLVAKFDWGEDVVRADFDVLVGDTVPLIQSASALGTPAGPIGVDPSTFLGTASSGKVSSFKLGELGELRAVTPVWPLKSSWFEWVAPKGMRVVASPESSFITNGQRFVSGERAEVSSSVSQIWALIVSESDIGGKVSGPVRGKLVVFAKRGLIEDYVRRITNLTNKRSILDSVRHISGIVPATQEATPAGVLHVPGVSAVGDVPDVPNGTLPPPPGSF